MLQPRGAALRFSPADQAVTPCQVSRTGPCSAVIDGSTLSLLNGRSGENAAEPSTTARAERVRVYGPRSNASEPRAQATTHAWPSRRDRRRARRSSSSRAGAHLGHCSIRSLLAVRQPAQLGLGARFLTWSESSSVYLYSSWAPLLAGERDGPAGRVDAGQDYHLLVPSRSPPSRMAAEQCRDERSGRYRRSRPGRSRSQRHGPQLGASPSPRSTRRAVERGVDGADDVVRCHPRSRTCRCTRPSTSSRSSAYGFPPDTPPRTTS